jgi:alpha-tubulin suppressor-like RCC1 family protein
VRIFILFGNKLIANNKMFKINDKELQAHTVSCGFNHSAAINKYGQLFVWGDNSCEQLQEFTDPKKDVSSSFFFFIFQEMLERAYLDKAEVRHRESPLGAAGEVILHG